MLLIVRRFLLERLRIDRPWSSHVPECVRERERESMTSDKPKAPKPSPCWERSVRHRAKKALTRAALRLMGGNWAFREEFAQILSWTEERRHCDNPFGFLLLFLSANTKNIFEETSRNFEELRGASRKFEELRAHFEHTSRNFEELRGFLLVISQISKLTTSADLCQMCFLSSVPCLKYIANLHVGWIWALSGGGGINRWQILCFTTC